MEIAYKSNKYFSFKLDDWERKTEAGKRMLETLKNEIPKSHRFYFPEIQAWMIAHEKKVQFADILVNFIFELTQQRQEDFFGL